MENSLCLTKEREDELISTYLPMILNLIPEREPWLYNGIRGILQDLVMDTFYGAMNQFEGATLPHTEEIHDYVWAKEYSVNGDKAKGNKVFNVEIS